jgi:hypothetical protein
MIVVSMHMTSKDSKKYRILLVSINLINYRQLRVIKMVFIMVSTLPLIQACNSKSSNAGSSTQEQDGWVSIFNGENLDGWINHGLEKWYVEKGEIICESGSAEEYGYLSTEKFYDNYELTLEFKQEANGNSGVFFRSTLEGVKISGWQVEVAPPENHTGGIYESYGRGWLIQPEPHKDAALKMGDWNLMRIMVANDKVTTWLNGQEMVSIKDTKIGQGKGAIALQIHDGGGIKVRWRNLKVREISEVEAEEFAADMTDTWDFIFDGISMDGWRAYNGEAMPPQWVVKDGILTFDAELKLEEEFTGGKDIIYADQEYAEFDLAFDWKIPEGGNSGVFYHLKEGYDAPWMISPEYQLIDDAGWERLNNATLEGAQKVGSDYAMYAADDQTKVIKPAGEWNSSRIRFTKDQVEYFLNGAKTVSFVPWSEDWEKRRSNGKWKDFPDYGKFKSGFIGFQDHDSPLWFKNIKIKQL